MSGFSADWLNLRAPADAAARSTVVLQACQAYFAGRRDLNVCDIGAGIGATPDALKDVLPDQRRWRLIDIDQGNLEIAKQRLGAAGETVEIAAVDVARDPAPWTPACGFVTASALFDLAGIKWIERFVAALSKQRLPLLALLTYDGAQQLTPAHPDDAAMLQAFNHHQLLDKGLGGGAAGPGAAPALIAALEAAGYKVLQDPSPWRLTTAKHPALIAETLNGWANACIKADLIAATTANRWLQDRLARTDTLTVGHVDIFATPI